MDFIDLQLSSVDTILFVAANVILTLLISFRLIRAQRRLASVMPDTDHRFYLGIVSVLVESAAPVAVFGVALAVATLCYDKSFPGGKAAVILQPIFCAALVNELSYNTHCKLTLFDRPSLRRSLSSASTLGHLGLTRLTRALCFPAPFSLTLQFRPDLMKKAASRFPSGEAEDIWWSLLHNFIEMSMVVVISRRSFVR